MDSSETKTESEVVSTPTATHTSTTNTSSSPVMKNEKKGVNKLLIFFVLFFGACCLCCFCFFAFFGAIFNVVFKQAGEALKEFTVICDASESELENAYDDLFTEEYKDTTSFAEFMAFYEDNDEFFAQCKDLESVDFQTLSKGFNFDYDQTTETANIELTTDNGVLQLEAVMEGTSWKINELDID